MAEPGNQNWSRERVGSLKEALEVYLSGRSGIRFEELVRFAGPLFDLYDIDWRTRDTTDSFARDSEELSTIVAVLDAARLLWAFFALDEEDSVTRLPELEDAMLGRAAGDEERSNLLILLSLLEEHWHSFSAEDRRRAESTPGFALPSFEVLVSEFARSGERPRPARGDLYGPDRLELPEALALFAEPLIQDPAAKSDPDVLEERVARAQAYWELARMPEEQFDDALGRLADALSGPELDPEAVREEAVRMVRRYRRLFPEGTGT